MEFSFSASGWLFIYQLGVAKAFQTAGVHLPPHCVRCTGSSGGALVSACLAIDADISLLKEYFLDCVANCRLNSLINMFKMRDYVNGAFVLVKSSLAKTRSKQDVNFISETGEFYRHSSLLNGRLGVSVTVLPSCNNYIITKFDSQTEIEEGILGSCTMSPLAGFPFRITRPYDKLLDNKWVFDGGLSNVQPYTGISNRVITVSPFYQWDCDIKPSKYVPIWWGLFPPSVEDMEDLFQLGVSDAERWLEDNREIFSKDQENNLINPLTDISSTTGSCSSSDEEKNPEVVNPIIPSFVRDTREDLESPNEDIEKDKQVSIVSGEESYKVVRYRIKNYDEVLNQVQLSKRMTRTNLHTIKPEPIGLFNQYMDKMVLFTQKNLIKSIAVGSIYAELTYFAYFNLVKGVTVAVEKKRRHFLPQSSHMLSIRRWLPLGSLGSSRKSIKTSVNVAREMLSPQNIWTSVSEKLRERRKERRQRRRSTCAVDMGEAVETMSVIGVKEEVVRKSELSNYSFVYRTLLSYVPV